MNNLKTKRKSVPILDSQVRTMLFMLRDREQFPDPPQLEKVMSEGLPFHDLH